MKKLAILGVAALVVSGLGISVSAVAATQSQFYDNAISVSFSDLNIQNDAGARVLYMRLQRATKSVCGTGSYLQLGSLARVSQTEECYADTLDEAVAKIDSDALDKIHAS